MDVEAKVAVVAGAEAVAEGAELWTTAAVEEPSSDVVYPPMTPVKVG